MSISTISSAIKTVIAKHANYNETGTQKNITIADYSILNIGIDRACVIEYKPSSHGTGSPIATTGGGYISDHVFTLRVMHRVGTDAETTYTDLLTDIDTVMGTVNAYFKLSSTSNVLKAQVTETGEVMALFNTSGSGPYFLYVDIKLEITEEVSVTFLE